MAQVVIEGSLPRHSEIARSRSLLLLGFIMTGGTNQDTLLNSALTINTIAGSLEALHRTESNLTLRGIIISSSPIPETHISVSVTQVV